MLQRNPFVFDSLLHRPGRQAARSARSCRRFVHNTVDNPIFPNTGKRLTTSIDLAVLGGNTQFYKPRVEAIAFFRHTSRTSVGFRGQFEYIAPIGGTTSLPIFERLFLGGEYSVRGFDIRSIGPTVPGSLVVLGGNKSLLFNAEYLFSIVSQVRIVVFYDAGQVRDFGQPFALKEDLTEIWISRRRRCWSIRSPTSGLTDPNAPRPDDGRHRPDAVRSRRRPASSCGSSCRC